MGLRDRETWVFSGDSITQGVFHTHGWRGWVEIVAECLRWREGRVLDAVINSGCSGWTTRDVLADFDQLIGRWSPTIVSIALGTNDASIAPGNTPISADDYRCDLTDLVRRSRDLGARVILQTPVLISPSAREFRPDFDAFVEACRQVAHDTGTPLVDHDRHWRAAFAGIDPVAWLDDPIHPNAAGHLEMAQLFLDHIGLPRWADTSLD